MATILVEQSIDLKEIIVKTIRKYGGGSRSIHDIKMLINQEYGGSLNYSDRAFLAALEVLVYDGLHVDNMRYQICIKIFPRFFKKYEIKFWLLEVHTEDKVEGFNPPPGVQLPKEWPNPAGITAIT